MDAKEWCKNFWAQFVAEANPQERRASLKDVDWNEVRLGQQIAHNRELSAQIQHTRSVLCELVAIDPKDQDVETYLMLVQSAAHKILRGGTRYG
jgi:hypothetical protein